MSVQSIERWTYLVFCVGTDIVARLTFPEGRFAGLRVLRWRSVGRGNERDSADDPGSHRPFSCLLELEGSRLRLVSDMVPYCLVKHVGTA